MKQKMTSSFKSTHNLLIGALCLSLLFNGVFLFQSYRSNVVTSVPDGDSLQLASGQRIRLLGIDAPERDMCMATEARDALERTAKGKHVTLHDTITDDYGRTLANVFIGFRLVNNTMVSQGFARYISVRSAASETLKTSQNISKQNKIGIWSETCRKTSNPDCQIKGNTRGSQQIYHLPECKNYDQTIVDTAFGDQWFCMESDAIKAGFSKASGCPH